MPRQCTNPETLAGGSLTGFPIEAARYRHCLPFLLTLGDPGHGLLNGWAVHFRAHPWACRWRCSSSSAQLSTLLIHTASALLVDIFPGRSSSACASGKIVQCALSAVLAAALEPLVGAVGRGWYFTMFSLFVSAGGLVSVHVSRWMGTATGEV